jgi:predicted KAP-like P-loop ATPase
MTKVNTKSDMDELAESNSVFADTPLMNPQQDRLGYAPFAKHLADSICKMNFPGGFVIAVYGSWGFGKSTLLNFLIHYLKEKPEDEQPVVIQFNPWLFSGDEDITRRFINQLQTSLNQLKSSVPKGIKTRITGLIKAISEIPVPYAQAGKAVVRLFDQKQRDTSELKENLEDKLEDQHPRVVVTIDDIDKLATHDIAQLFRLLKAIPTFTNVVYILVFHKETVAKALAETQATAGTIDFERIIQAAFELPLPDKTSLHKLLFEKLNSIFVDTPKHYDPTYWADVYFQGIDYLIRNPQDIVQLINALTVVYPVVKDEVNLVDLIAIEAVRTFHPNVYNIIRKHPGFFAGYADQATTLNELEQFHNSWLAQLKDDDKEPIKRLLSQLFPKLQTIYQHRFYSAENELRWREHLRICSSAVFPVYFRLTLTEGEFPDTEVKAVLAAAANSKEFATKLLELANQKRSDGTTQLRAFLEQIETYTENHTEAIPTDQIPAIVHTFFDLGDSLLQPEDEPHGMFDLGNDDRILRLVWQLLDRLSEAERFEILKEAISTGRALSLMVRAVATLEQTHEVSKSGSEEWLQQHHLQTLKEIALQRLRDAAQQNTLLQTPKLPENLDYWQKWAGAAEVKQWVQAIIESDQELINLLQQILPQNLDQPESDVNETNANETNYESVFGWLTPYVEPAQVIERINSLDQTELTESELTEAQKTAIAGLI